MKPEIILFLSDARGVYIPRDFAKDIKRIAVSGISDEDYEILESGPDHEWYWEAWHSVCENAVITDDKGVKYRVYQDGDCFLIPDGMEWSDKDNFFVWPAHDVVPI
jgi:hypothetical protein